MAYTKYSLIPANNNAAPPDGAPEGMLPSAVNDTMRDMMAQIKDCGDGIRGGTYTMTAPVITGGSISGSTINNAVIGGTTRAAGSFTDVTTTNDASISGLTVGKGGGTQSANTAFGISALTANTTGNLNTAIGYLSFVTNTTGAENTALGAASLYTNNGNYNVAVGRSALLSNTTGSNNTGLGYQALQANTTAPNNTAVGYQAGYSNQTGEQLTAIGTQSLQNTTTNFNTAVGYQSANKTTTGTNLAVLGRIALYNNTTGSNNTAIGQESLYSNTTASQNTAVGYQAGYNNTTSSNNSYFGNQAGLANVTGAGNCYFGVSSGVTATGSNNSFYGFSAGYLVTSGAKNTIIGGYSGNQGGLNITTSSNYIVLSDGDGNPRQVIDGSGNVMIGATSVYSSAKVSILNNTTSTQDNAYLTFAGTLENIGYVNFDNNYGTMVRLTGTKAGGGGAADEGYFSVKTALNGTLTGGVYISAGGTGWSAISDERTKTGLIPIENAIAKVQTLRAVTGRYKTDPTATSRAFLIAQDVQAVLPEAISETEQNGEKLLGLAYSDTIPLLVAAIKELNTKLEAQALEIATLKGL